MSYRQKRFFYDICPPVPHPDELQTKQKHNQGRGKDTSSILTLPIKKRATVNSSFQEQKKRNQQKQSNYQNQIVKDEVQSQYRSKSNSVFGFGHPQVLSEIDDNYEQLTKNESFVKNKAYKHNLNKKSGHNQYSKQSFVKNRNTHFQEQTKCYDQKSRKPSGSKEISKYEDINEHQIMQKIGRVDQLQNEINERLKRMFIKVSIPS